MPDAEIMRLIIFLVLSLSFCTFAMGQITKYSDTTYHILINKRPKAPSATSNGITIQNSFPKGDRYTDPNGKAIGYAVFWTRVMNETASPLDLSINFPADTLAISGEPVSYVKVFLPPDKMTMDKESLYNYGATGLTSFWILAYINQPCCEKLLMLMKSIFFMSEYTLSWQLMVPHEQDWS